MRLPATAGLAAFLLVGTGASAQQLGRPTVDSPPPSAIDAMSSGIGDRAVRMHGDVRAALARGTISPADAASIGRDLMRIENLLSYHVPRSYGERVRLRARLDALQARLDSASQRG